MINLDAENIGVCCIFFSFSVCSVAVVVLKMISISIKEMVNMEA